MTSINCMFSVQKYDGLEETIPMMYHIEYKSTLRTLKSWWCVGLPLSLRDKERLRWIEIDRESLTTTWSMMFIVIVLFHYYEAHDAKKFKI